MPFLESTGNLIIRQHVQWNAYLDTMAENIKITEQKAAPKPQRKHTAETASTFCLWQNSSERSPSRVGSAELLTEVFRSRVFRKWLTLPLMLLSSSRNQSPSRDVRSISRSPAATTQHGYRHTWITSFQCSCIVQHGCMYPCIPIVSLLTSLLNHLSLHSPPPIPSFLKYLGLFSIMRNLEPYNHLFDAYHQYTVFH